MVRCKENIKFIGYEEKELPENRFFNISKDEKVLLEDPKTRKSYMNKLRIITVYDDKNKTTVYLLTNNLN